MSGELDADIRQAWAAAEIPATREEAIALLVEQDVLRWGEGEREASKEHHASRSYGRALNELANRAELAGLPQPDLRRAAYAELSSSDWLDLEQGG